MVVVVRETMRGEEMAGNRNCRLVHYFANCGSEKLQQDHESDANVVVGHRDAQTSFTS